MVSRTRNRIRLMPNPWSEEAAAEDISSLYMYRIHSSATTTLTNSHVIGLP
jgi:hypothetical protein